MSAASDRPVRGAPTSAQSDPAAVGARPVPESGAPERGVAGPASPMGRTAASPDATRAERGAGPRASVNPATAAPFARFEAGRHSTPPVPAASPPPMRPAASEAPLRRPSSAPARAQSPPGANLGSAPARAPSPSGASFGKAAVLSSRTGVCPKHGLARSPAGVCIRCKNEEPSASGVLALRAAVTLGIAALCFYSWLYLF